VVANSFSLRGNFTFFKKEDYQGAWLQSRRIAKKPLFVRRQSFLCFTTRVTNNNNNNNNTVVHSRARS